MRIPKYWTKGTYADAGGRGSFTAWGWSGDSLAAAEQDAIARAKRACERMAQGARPDTYGYFDRPMREEIVETRLLGGKAIGVITRNRYGALVLNSASVCFVDVDFPRVASTGLLDAVRGLFGGKKAGAAQDAAVQGVRQWAQHNPTRSFRMYRTLKGLRLLFTDRVYDPVSSEVGALFAELGSDPLYRTLTEKQQCFRARLTPKPWRCGFPAPPNQYPWADAEAESTYRQWEQAYEQATGSYATCRLIETIGGASVNDTVAAIQDIHDQYTCRADGAVLA